MHALKNSKPLINTMLSYVNFNYLNYDIKKTVHFQVALLGFRFILLLNKQSCIISVIPVCLML